MRYLLGYVPDGSPNPNTHAYGHKSLVEEVEVIEDRPDNQGEEILVETRQQNKTQNGNQESNFIQKHQRVLKTLAKQQHDSDVDLEFEEIPNGDANGLLTGPMLKRAEEAAAARPGFKRRIEDVVSKWIKINGPRAHTPPVQVPVSVESKHILKYVIL